MQEGLEEGEEKVWMIEIEEGVISAR